MFWVIKALNNIRGLVNAEFLVDFLATLLPIIRLPAAKILYEVGKMYPELVHIGFGNILAMNRIIAMASPNSAPTKRIVQEVRNKGLLIDMTSGRRTKAVIFTDSGHVVLAALAPETISGRLQASRTIPILKTDVSVIKDEI